MSNRVNADYPENIYRAVNPMNFPSVDVISYINLSLEAYDPVSNRTGVLNDVLVPDREDYDTDSLEDYLEENIDNNEEIAYWLQEELSECIYGVVRKARILRRRKRPHPDNNEANNENNLAQWEITQNQCAIKQMPLDQITRLRHTLMEDPIREMKAMKFISQCLFPHRQDHQEDPNTLLRMMEDHKILSIVDLLGDGDFFYIVMPYCKDGELLYLLDANYRFTEAEARFWMQQILHGVHTLQSLGLCHRDLSLENIIVHEESCFIMDFGMCCRIPFTNIPPDSENYFLPATRGHRRLMNPNGKMGKLKYVSPEIFQNRLPFDGFAVDLWAVGVILFTMVTGDYPWEIPHPSNERFRRCTTGELTEILTSLNLGLSEDVMDLLQGMLWHEPRQRFSLEQVCDHRWMQGEAQRPPPRPEWANMDQD